MALIPPHPPPQLSLQRALLKGPKNALGLPKEMLAGVGLSCAVTHTAVMPHSWVKMINEQVTGLRVDIRPHCLPSCPGASGPGLLFPPPAPPPPCPSPVSSQTVSPHPPPGSVSQCWCCGLQNEVALHSAAYPGGVGLLQRCPCSSSMRDPPMGGPREPAQAEEQRKPGGSRRKQPSPPHPCLNLRSYPLCSDRR